MRPERKGKVAKVMAYLMLLFGVLNLVDWLYGGRTDSGDLLVGAGFLLMSPHAFSDSDARIAARFHDSGISGVLAPLMCLGAVAVIAGFVVRWL